MNTTANDLLAVFVIRLLPKGSEHMAIRTSTLFVENYNCTNNEDDYVEVTVTNNNYAFGSDVPTYISFDFPLSSLKANYDPNGSGVTFSWEIVLHFQNGSNVTIYEGTIYSCTANTNLSVSNIELSSEAVSLLQQSTIEYIELFPTRENRRLLEGKGGYATCYIEYEEYNPDPYVEWYNTSLNVSTSNGQVHVSWNPATVVNGSNSNAIQYIVACTISGQGFDGSEYTAVTTNTSHSFTPPAYNTELFLQITAEASGVHNVKYSEGVKFSVAKPINNYRTIRCYINNQWQDCIVRYFDGSGWIDCTPKYYDGTQWLECSF